MEDLTREALYTYLLAVKNGAREKNKGTDLARASEETMIKYSMREGAVRIADDLIRRFGLDAEKK